MKHLFVGLDVHKKTWSVTLQEGQVILKRFSMEAKADTLIHYIQKHYRDYSVECCYEACCCGFHIYRNLTAAGWKVLVAGPGDIPRANKQSVNKSDKVDSRYLCHHLASGHLKGISVPEAKQEQFRSLFRRRADLVKNLRKIKCHIKAMLLYYGVELPEHYDNINWSKAMTAWIQKLKWLYPTAAGTMKSRLQEYEWRFRGK